MASDGAAYVFLYGGVEVRARSSHGSTRFFVEDKLLGAIQHETTSFEDPGVLTFIGEYARAQKDIWQTWAQERRASSRGIVSELVGAMHDFVERGLDDLEKEQRMNDESGRMYPGETHPKHPTSDEATHTSSPTYHIEDPSLVLVTWEDTTCDAIWRLREDVMDWAQNSAYLCQNVGWLVYEDEYCIVVASRLAEGTEHVAAQTGLHERIPRPIIKSIVSLATGKRRLNIGLTQDPRATQVDGFEQTSGDEIDPIDGMPDFTR